MTSKHAGSSRIADQALIDQVRACADEMKAYLDSPLAVMSRAQYHAWLNRWAGRAHWLLEQIGEMGE